MLNLRINNACSFDIDCCELLTFNSFTGVITYIFFIIFTLGGYVMNVGFSGMGSVLLTQAHF